MKSRAIFMPVYAGIIASLKSRPQRSIAMTTEDLAIKATEDEVCFLHFSAGVTSARFSNGVLYGKRMSSHYLFGEAAG
ncbi:hypothetical protein JTE90_013329 [Oedothorax gibbosus]|uniref:Uncharacterized protein n=1 Tax=Oedothorax gibbosus TaxID=931172 RepID=A0AAV6VD20_9ARAC|nr:hypothetical protein JTE90_013329 [Oedothorax gibbosus]